MEGALESLTQIGFALALLGVAFITGRRVERRHFASIRARERELRGLPAVTFRRIPSAWTITEVGVVAGSAVWTAPANVRDAPRLARFVVVVRDGRGGSDFVERRICVAP